MKDIDKLLLKWEKERQLADGAIKRGQDRNEIGNTASLLYHQGLRNGINFCIDELKKAL